MAARLVDRRLLLMLVALVVSAAEAQAATIQVAGNRLEVDVTPSADAGGGTAGAVFPIDGGALVALYGALLPAPTVGAGCQSVATSNAPTMNMTGFVNKPPSFAATCNLSGVLSVGADLQATGSKFNGWLSTIALPVTVVAATGASDSADIITTGPGGDRITTGTGADIIDPGGAPAKGQAVVPGTSATNMEDPSSNIIDTGAGNDTIRLSAALGSDLVTGGAGIDTVSYADRFPIGAPGQKGITVTLDGVANDGDPALDPPGPEIGERDNIRADVETVIATRREDTLTGSASANRLEGLEGVDALKGGDGPDVIVSREPASAGSGTPDTIACGLPNPAPSPTGTASVSLRDTLEADLADIKPSDCEQFNQMPVTEGAYIGIGSTARRPLPVFASR